MFKNIGQGLLFLHSMGIVHRDVKLDNVVLTEDLTVVKLIDFGLCVDMSSSGQETTSEVAGTLPYMAPEMLMKKQHNPKRTDIWALGVLLYRILFDKYPFRGRTEADLLQKITQKRLFYTPSVPDSLRGLLGGMMRRNPEERLTMLDIIDDKWLY